MENRENKSLQKERALLYMKEIVQNGVSNNKNKMASFSADGCKQTIYFLTFIFL